MSLPTSTFIDALVRALARHSDQAFGLMGNGNARLIDGLARLGIPCTTVRHEAGTVAAADAYTRVSGRLAIATTSYGAGFTNALTALAEAAQARTPMLVIAGDAPSDGPRPWDVDQEMLAAALGVRTHTLAEDNVDRLVDRAVAYALRARRPVVLGIPYDLVSGPAVTESLEADAEPTPEAEIDMNDPAVIAALSASVAESPALQPTRWLGGRRRTSADAARIDPPTGAVPLPADAVAPLELDAAMHALLHAQRPLLLAGRGAHLSGAAAELGAIADLLGAPTATTALARGIFPRPEYDLGVTGGFGQPAAMEVVSHADAVLVVGASLNQFTMRFGELFGAGTAVIRIDDDQVSAPAAHAPITHLPLRGDARAALAALHGALQAAGRLPSGWRESLSGLEPGGALRVRDNGALEHPYGICADGRLDPRAVAARLDELLPADRHVTTDGGHFIGWANTRWHVASPERLIMVGTAYQSIGLGFPTVAGVAAAAPGTTTVLSTGDGGGLMALSDLETAIRASPSCVVVVWNDGAYGAEVHLYGELGLEQQPMLIPDVDFAGVASALGAQGVRVQSLDDLEALRVWTASGAHGTILLDCRVSRTVVAEYQREIQRVNGLELPQ